MKFVRIIGIDPGLNSLGWGVIDSNGFDHTFINCGTLHTKATLLLPERIVALHHLLSEVIAEYKPHTAALEKVFVNSNNRSSLVLGHARGAIMLSLGLNNLVIGEYQPNTIKKSVVGKGTASKEQVKIMLGHLLRLPSQVNEEKYDATDALAAAICHAYFFSSEYFRNHNAS
jgi:crossover junction endodeoxyribonuclease RuvC